MLTQTRQNLQPVELIPALGYIRVSAWFEEKISDEIQKASIEDGARRRGRRIVAWITDLDATGRNFKRKIMEAIGAVETGEAEGAREIWVWKYSRFGRNRHGVAVNLARVEQAGGHLISSTEEVDATTATGRFTRGMLFELAAFESDRIGEQWRETHEYRRVHGLPATGGERFGYLWHRREMDNGILTVPENYEPNPDSAEAVKQIYEDYAHHDASFRDLADTLNDARILNPGAITADRWKRQTLRYYLDSGFAAGLLHVHRGDKNCPASQRCPHVVEHYGYIPGAQPPIISDDLWAAYRERRGQRKELPPRSRIPRYPFSGLAKCGLCGGAAVAANGSGGRRGYMYRCSVKYTEPELGRCRGAVVPSKWVEAEVLRWLGKAAVEIDRRLQGTVLTPKKAEPRVDSRKRERLAAEVTKIQQGLDRASTAYAMGDMPRDSYLRVRDELTAKREQLDSQLGGLRAEEREESKTTWEMRGAVVRSLLEEWDTLSVSGKRDLLSRAVTEIRVFPTGMEPRVVCVPREGFVF
jgi:DNA invertase Pin-like site-specific DNA recombinase